MIKVEIEPKVEEKTALLTNKKKYKNKTREYKLTIKIVLTKIET